MSDPYFSVCLFPHAHTHHYLGAVKAIVLHILPWFSGMRGVTVVSWPAHICLTLKDFEYEKTI